MTELRCRIEYRADDSRVTPGRLRGILMPYGEQSTDRPEVFEAGALEWPADGIMLREQHNRAAPILRFQPIERDGAVLIDVPLPNTTRGRDTAAGVQAGVYGGLSVEFHAIRERFDGAVRRIQRALLTGAGLVDDPSYPGAVAEVRASLVVPAFDWVRAGWL